MSSTLCTTAVDQTVKPLDSYLPISLSPKQPEYESLQTTSVIISDGPTIKSTQNGGQRSARNPKYDICGVQITTAAKISAVISVLGATANAIISVTKMCGGHNIASGSCFGINLVGSVLTIIFSSLCLAGVIQERSGLLIPAIVWKLIAFLCVVVAGILASLGLTFVTFINRSQTERHVEVVSVLQTVDTVELGVTLGLSVVCSVLIGLILIVLKRCYFYLRYKHSGTTYNTVL